MSKLIKDINYSVTMSVTPNPLDGGFTITESAPKYKELTDEEIQELALSDEFWISEDCTIFDWHKFARAILKRAQEK